MSDTDAERTPEEKLRAVVRNDKYNEKTRQLARRLLKRRQEGPS
jgi:hypothetical protein